MKNLKSYFVIRTSYIFYLFLITINYQLSTINCFAQNIDSKSLIQQINKSMLHKSSKSVESRWYNYATAMQMSIFPDGNADNYGLVYLFPDTTVMVKYSSSQILAPYIHGISVVLDPTAEIFYNEDSLLNMSLPRINKYKIDSLGILCKYTRHNPDINITDTLIVELISNLRSPVYSLLDKAAYFGFDTVNFIAMNFNPKYLSYVKPDFKTEVITKKILLTTETANDILGNGYNYIKIPLSTVNYYGNMVAATIRFKPGYTWIPYQSILNEDLNEFLFLTFEESGPGTYPNYYPGNYNVSQVIQTVCLRPKNQWYKLYVPSFSFPQNYKLENHWVDFRVTCNNVGINEVSSLKSDVRIYPNPAAELTTINYQLSTNSNVKFFITDLTGKKVMEINKGMQPAGKHYININVSALSNGLYFYTLSSEYSVITGKIIIKK